MPVNTIYTLAASQISVSGGGQLSGITQGDGTHLAGRTITLNSNAWDSIDVFDSTGDTSFDDSDTSQSLSGAQTLNGTSFANGARVEAEYELTLRDPDGNEYTVLGFNINEPGVTSYATVEGLAFVGGVGGFPPIGIPLTVIGTGEGPSYAYSALATPPCFTGSTLIDTPHGPTPIEDLAAGDLVITADHGPQPITWVRRVWLPAAVLARRPEFRPIRIAKDAFGRGTPYRDTALSPQHRVMVGDWRAALFFGEDEVLVAAKKLVNDVTVTVDHNAGEVSYYHLAFERHEIICGDGLMSESYLAASHDALETRRELLALFDTPRGDTPTARVCVTGPSAELLRPTPPICRGTARTAFP
ncbi:Hint domain-containing protein [Roseovarius sp. S4756]|uniref:Hint domain-containing protein n=1 Tax=Roseovarius maritimus TaxID=3342637 RepID=UPI003726EB61